VKKLGKKKREVIINQPLPSMPKEKIELPPGIRTCDLINLSPEDVDVLAELKVNGRRTRYYFERHGLMDAVRRLKSRGLIEPVRLNSNYAYDLTQFGYFAFEHHMI
jgi:hypothetical protein